MAPRRWLAAVGVAIALIALVLYRVTPRQLLAKIRLEAAH